MVDTQTQPTKTRARTVAVIDVGTSSIRMAIADIATSRESHQLESLTQSVEIGKDTFSNGEISQKTMEECIAVLKSYRSKLDEYQIVRQEDIRIVATSAVREASNSLNFVDRVYVATGLEVEILDAAETHRITYRGVQPLLKARPDLFEAMSFIVEVGGGNTEILLVEQGNVAWSTAYRLGSLRLQEALESSHIPQNKMRQTMESEILSHLETLSAQRDDHKTTHMVAIGSDIRFACSQILKKSVRDDELLSLAVDKFQLLVDVILNQTEESLVRKYHLTFAEAQTLGCSLLANLKCAEALGVDRILVSNTNLRDGLIRDLAEEGAWSEDFRTQIIRTARQLAHKYDVDEDHVSNVSELCQQLFQQLKSVHGLDDRFETLLITAAWLHEIGGYVNPSSIHKHSMYLIQNSSLFGLTRDDLQVVALVARYHRRALPKPTHSAYSSLDRVRRVAVAKMASILRIAIALDASRTQRIREIQCHIDRDRCVISVPYIDDLSLEQVAMRGGRQFFQSIFGTNVHLRPQVKSSMAEPSAQL